MPSTAIYNPRNVNVGDSTLYIAPAWTPCPPDNLLPFVPDRLIGKTLTANGATAVTLSVSNAQGVATTSSLTTFGSVTGAALKSALEGLANVGAGKVTVTAPGGGTAVAGGPFLIVFSTDLGACTLAVTASTGGTPTITGGLWVPLGATEAGFTFTKNVTTSDIGIEEQSNPVNRFIQSQTPGFSGNLAEDTIDNFGFATNMVKSYIAAGAGQPAVTQLVGTEDLVHYACYHESATAAGLSEITYIPDTVCTDTVTIAYRRTANPRLIPVSFGALCKPSEFLRRRVTAPATS